MWFQCTNKRTMKRHNILNFKKYSIPIVQASELAEGQLLKARIALLAILHHVQNLLVRNVPVEQANESLLQGGLGDGEGVINSEALVLGLHAEVVEGVSNLDFFRLQLLKQHIYKTRLSIVRR